ncbi:SGNH/GDSL hydrolase family protein [Paracoccus ravus]|uniref:SGNH/GDSL hydrolase family protein n=1 Tax=Paracoccus ravus TaxID=2447760 RepID=UPI00106F0750|nr:SGNH/GDSL hydrolase family protein [Paracoccus ravus]
MNQIGEIAGPLPQIEAAELERRLLDPDVPDEQIRPYLMANEAVSGAFRPEIRAVPQQVVEGMVEAAVALASLNGLDRWRRMQRYRRRSRDGSVLRIVSEGDSWFQYPFLLTDVIDWLSGPYAIMSLDAAGDLLSDIVRQGELITAVVQERPKAVLLSGGGNDLLGAANLARALRRFEPGLGAGDYLGRAFDENLGVVLDGYRQLFARLRQVAPQVPVLTHVYDYALPAGGRWLGQPMQALGISDAGLQRAIIRAIVDRFHKALTEVAAGFPQVRVIDTRGTVAAGQWHDELHPTDAGYRRVAALFVEAISKALGMAVPPLGGVAEMAVVEAAPEAVPRPDTAPFDEPVLLREIGRRAALAECGDLSSPSEPMVFPSSISGVYPELEEKGRAIVAGFASSGQIESGSADPTQAALIQIVLSRRGAADGP